MIKEAGIAFLVSSVTLNAGASILLKFAARSEVRGVLPLENPRLLLAVGLALLCYAGAFVSYYAALRHFNLSTAYITITGAAAVLICMASVAFLGEVLSGRNILGILLTLVGICLITLPAKDG
jgi:multidrug transporter EmrE-like cation transporter